MARREADRVGTRKIWRWLVKGLRESVAQQAQRLGIAEIEERLGKCRVTIWRWCRAGRFPLPHYIGERRCWWLHEIEAWEREEMARPTNARRGARNLTGCDASPAEEPRP